MLMAVALAGSSCASLPPPPSRHTCTSYVLDDEPVLEVIGLRHMIGRERHCVAAKVPGVYRIRREAYTVEFWTGDRWYPSLHLRVLTPTGERLRIRSPQFDSWDRSEYEARGDGSMYQTGYDNRFDGPGPRSSPPKERIEFTVLDREGREVGRESVRVSVKPAGEWFEY